MPDWTVRVVSCRDILRGKLRVILLEYMYQEKFGVMNDLYTAAKSILV